MSFQSGVSNGTILYMDSTVVLTTTISVQSQVLNLTGGANNDQVNAFTQYFAGTIDELAIYNTVLMPEKVLAHYQAAF